MKKIGIVTRLGERHVFAVEHAPATFFLQRNLPTVIVPRKVNASHSEKIILWL